MAELLGYDNAQKRSVRDKLNALVTAGANPDQDNTGTGQTDREYFAWAYSTAVKKDWDGNSFWDAKKNYETYLRTYDNNKIARQQAEAKANAELTESRKSFTDALELQAKPKSGGIVVKSTAVVAPAGKANPPIKFSPAVAVGIVAVSFVAMFFLRN